MNCWQSSRRPTPPFGDGIDETWIHVQLAESVDPKAVAEVKRLLPSVLADARQVALDSSRWRPRCVSLAHELDSDPEGRFPGSDRKDVAALLRWLADGHFVLLGYQRCQVSDGQSSVDPSSRLGVLRLRTRRASAANRTATTCWCWRRPPCPATCATAPTRTSWSSANTRGTTAIEHRFVGLFTVAAMNANVLEIPLISRRVNDALALAHRDPSHPGQLLLDIIQTIPRSELFALSAKELLDMAMAVVDLGSRRRTLLFLRADSTRALRVVPGLPSARPVHHRGPAGDAGHPGPRARRRQHRLRRAGQRITLGSSAFHGAPARGLPSRRTSTSRSRTSPASRTCSPRPPGPGGTG